MTATTKGPIMADDTAALADELMMIARCLPDAVSSKTCATINNAADTITAQAAEIARMTGELDGMIAAKTNWNVRANDMEARAEKAEAALAAAEAQIETLDALLSDSRTAYKTAASERDTALGAADAIGLIASNLEARVAVLEGALTWYGEQSRLARLIHSEGDAGRHAIAADGGAKASAALARGAAA